MDLAKMGESISELIAGIFKERPRFSFFEGCWASTGRFWDKGCNGALGRLKLANGLDKGDVIVLGEQISGDEVTVVS